ncbi:WXG100 family type VII secretion target [Pseudonocardia hispaniensis]|uniref:ESAT-6-like protein n=1 Tax=Pseudonocardia hispaniensis TaxID=904933 RepID=A0ABW1IW68_9PSEU
MAGGFGTTTEEMARAGRHVLEVNDAVQSELSVLRGRLAPLAGAWRGDAAAAFTSLMARWDADARSLNEALRGIGDAINGSAQDYQRQEDEQAGCLSSIRSALG